MSSMYQNINSTQIIKHWKLQKLLTQECKHLLGLQYKAIHQSQDLHLEVSQQHSKCQLLPCRITIFKMHFHWYPKINYSNVMMHCKITTRPHFVCIYVLSTQSFWFSSSVSCLVALTRCIWITNIKSKIMVFLAPRTNQVTRSVHN